MTTFLSLTAVQVLILLTSIATGRTSKEPDRCTSMDKISWLYPFEYEFHNQWEHRPEVQQLECAVGDAGLFIHLVGKITKIRIGGGGDSKDGPQEDSLELTLFPDEVRMNWNRYEAPDKPCKKSDCILSRVEHDVELFPSHGHGGGSDIEDVRIIEEDDKFTVFRNRKIVGTYKRRSKRRVKHVTYTGYFLNLYRCVRYNLPLRSLDHFYYAAIRQDPPIKRLDMSIYPPGNRRIYISLCTTMEKETCPFHMALWLEDNIIIRNSRNGEWEEQDTIIAPIAQAQTDLLDVSIILEGNVCYAYINNKRTPAFVKRRNSFGKARYIILEGAYMICLYARSSVFLKHTLYDVYGKHCL